MKTQIPPRAEAQARNDRARLALEGLSTADAFGEQLLHAGASARLSAV